MTINRRFVLKRFALAGVAGAMAGPARAFAGLVADAADNPVASGQSLLALVNDDRAGRVFLDGARSLTGDGLEVPRAGSDLAFLTDLERRLRSGRPLSIIGLLDDAAGTLVVDVARGTGARLQWLGQHSAQARTSSHHLLTAGSARDGARALARNLQACGAGFELRHEGHADPAPVTVAAAASGNSAAVAEQWLHGTGGQLAALALQRPPPALPQEFAAQAGDPVRGHFVSFLILT